MTYQSQTSLVSAYKSDVITAVWSSGGMSENEVKAHAKPLCILQMHVSKTLGLSLIITSLTSSICVRVL